MTDNEKMNFVWNFAKMLADEGDTFFTSGNTNHDYEFITSLIKSQGYWAGTSLRYFFDEDYNLLRTEERMFGK